MGGWLARCMGGWLWQVSYAVENPEKPWKLELLHMESPGEVDEWWNFYLGYLCLNRLTESLGSGSEPINVFADILLANLVSELNCLPRKKMAIFIGKQYFDPGKPYNIVFLSPGKSSKRCWHVYTKHVLKP